MKLISGAQQSSNGKLKTINREKSRLSIAVEEDRKRKEQQKRSGILESSQKESLNQTQEQIGLQEDNRGGFASFFMRNAKDLTRLVTRGKQDEDYLRQIEQNNKTISEILKAKKSRPEKEGEYNLMLETLAKKNDMLVGATGGNTKDLNTGQMFAKSVGAVTEFIPTLGGGMTAAGAAARQAGGRVLAGSLAKEGLSFGLIGGASEVVEKKQTKPAEIFGTVATNAIIGTVAGVGLGLGMTKLADKLGEYFAGNKVIFTPKEKDVLEENVPEFSDEELFRQAGLESPIEKTDTDLTAKTIAASDDEADIKSILSGKVPDEDADFLSKSLKNITDEDEIASILDEYDPAKIKANLAEKISMLDNEKRIGSLIKDTVSETDIPRVSKLLKNMENEDEIVKVLNEFESKKLADDAAKVVEDTTVQTPEVKIDEPSTKKNKPEDPLIQEARKYKSAEEFVKAQPKLFHGGTADIQEIKLGKSNFQKTFYMSDNADYAKSYGGSKSSLNEISLDKNANLADMRKPNPDLIKKIEKAISGEKTGKIIKIKKPDGSYVDVPEIKGGSSNAVYSNSAIIQGLKDGKAMYAELPEVKQALKKLGYDGQITAESKFGSNYGVWNKDVLKTKSQLTDLYNKSQGGKTEAPKAKVEEPKTNREPKKETPKVEKPTPSPKKTPSGLSESTIEKAVRADIMRETIEIPELSTMDMDEQAKMATKLLFDDTEKAIDIALGNQNPPNGVKAGSVYIAVRNYALANNDFDLIKELATADKINNFARALGQEVKAFDGSMYSDPVQVMKEVINLKNQIFKKSGKNPKKEIKETMERMTKAMDENTSTDEAFEAFIKSKKC